MNQQTEVQMMLAEKMRRQAERKRSREAFYQWLRELFCHHQTDYVGYAVYPSYRQINSRRERMMYNIDTVKLCPKCGRIFDYRKPYKKGLSRKATADLIHKLEQGGHKVVIAQSVDNQLRTANGLGNL